MDHDCFLQFLSAGILLNTLVVDFATDLHWINVTGSDFFDECPAYESLPDNYISQGTSVYSGVIQVSGSFGIASAALVMIASDLPQLLRLLSSLYWRLKLFL